MSTVQSWVLDERENSVFEQGRRLLWGNHVLVYYICKFKLPMQIQFGNPKYSRRLPYGSKVSIHLEATCRVIWKQSLLEIRCIPRRGQRQYDHAAEADATVAVPASGLTRREAERKDVLDETVRIARLYTWYSVQ